jgi:excinuclease UvrABC ATPase subunit
VKAGKSIKGVYTSYQIVSDSNPNNYRIEKIMDYPCNSKKELEDKENEIILEYNEKCINTYGKQDSKNTRKYYKKYYKDNVQSYKDYYNIVKDKVKEQYQSKKTHIHCKECGYDILNVSMNKHIKSRKHLNSCNLYASKLETN